MLTFSMQQTKSMIYEQEIYNQFVYTKDRLFFHSYPGDVSSVFEFSDYRTTNIYKVG